MIRKINASDGPLLRDVRLRALREAPEAFAQTVGEVEGDSDERWRQRAAEMAFEEGSAVVFFAFGEKPTAMGMAGGYRRAARRHEAVLWGVWVDPAARGTGVGRQLVERVVAWAQTHGCRHLSLRVATTGNHAARLYRSIGFRQEGEPQPHPHMPGVEEIAMILDLSDMPPPA